MSQTHKVALITGGSRGIGRTLSLTLARRNYRVVVVGRTVEHVEETIDLIGNESVEGPASHLGIALDIGVEENVSKLVSSSLARFGSIDVLIACAGVGTKADSSRVLPHPFHKLPLDEWEEVIGVNLTGTFLINREVARVMLKQGRGHIINVCSSTTPTGLRGTAYAPAYCASKFGVVGLTESLALEVRDRGIRVQAVFPGPVDTPLVNDTRLARPFGGSLSAETFAEILLKMIDQPLDATLIHPHVLPFTNALEIRRKVSS